jgi:hypothetical protein
MKKEKEKGGRGRNVMVEKGRMIMRCMRMRKECECGEMRN